MPKRHTPRQAPNGAATELERTRQVLQAEIDVYKQQIIDKTRLLNLLLPINRLPPEVLTEVLIHWTDATKDLSPSLDRSWTRIAHVCHYWREAALSSPRLWSNFALGALDWTREMLVRSKLAPLRIAVFSLHTRLHVESLKLVLQELPRIEKFEFRFLDEIDNGMELGPSAPLLRSLIFASSGMSRLWEPAKTSIVSLMEKADMPKLTRLQLLSCNVPWSSPLFRPTLTQLMFHDMHAKYARSDFAQVLRVLESMPLLRDLDLRGVLPDVVGDATALPVLDPRVSLHALQNLSIAGTAQSCAFLLQHMDFSVNCLRIDCTTAVSEGWTTLALTIASILRGSHSPTASAVSLRSMLLTPDGMTAWNSVHSLETLGRMYRHSTGELSPTLKLSVPAILLGSILDDLATLPLEEVQSCMIASGKGGTHSPQWQELFQAMPNVRELGVFEATTCVMSALAQLVRVPVGQYKGRNGKQTSDVLLPNLKTLSLCLVRFRVYINEPDEDSTLTRTKEMLEARKKARRQVEKLLIQGCINFGHEDCKSLEGLVKEVDWDKAEDWYEDEEDDYTEGYYREEDMAYRRILGSIEDDFNYPW